jgi:hypothetical protein
MWEMLNDPLPPSPQCRTRVAGSELEPLPRTWSCSPLQWSPGKAPSESGALSPGEDSQGLPSAILNLFLMVAINEAS